ncbi:MAG TPA: hypothetical protein PKC44_14060, partial [Agitococcus sp.]|nr:hypothetical protein [Agitococcus sp.]
ATVPKELTVNNGKASFVLKTTEAVATVQIKINTQTYSLVPDASKKSWTFNANNLVQQGQVNYELAILKNGALTAIKQTGTITLKSSVVIQPMQKWQEASLAYAEKYHKLYVNTPMRNVAGNVCGTYTFCYAFSRNADGIKIPSNKEAPGAYPAFLFLKNSAKYSQFTHATTNFVNIPLGAVVFFKGGAVGHAAIKVSATEIISQGQLSKYDCTISKVRFDSMKNLILVGYYAPSDGVTGLDDINNLNLILPELRVARNTFAQALSAALRSFDKTLPAKDADLIVLLKLFNSNPLTDSTPMIRQDAARVLDRGILYFESLGFKFKRVTDNRFDADDTLPSDVRLIARRLAELGIFQGVPQEDGSFKFYGSQQLSKEEMQIVIERLHAALQNAEKPSVFQQEVLTVGNTVEFLPHSSAQEGWLRN